MRNVLFGLVFLAGCATSPSPLEIKVEMLETKVDLLEARLNAALETKGVKNLTPGYPVPNK